MIPNETCPRCGEYIGDCRCPIDRVSYPALSFEQLAEANAQRNRITFDGGSWSPTDWACAVAGEVGEACNLIKKLRRGEEIDLAEIGKELADAVIYIDLLAQKLDLVLGVAVREKFNEVSRRRNSPITL